MSKKGRAKRVFTILEKKSRHQGAGGVWKGWEGALLWREETGGKERSRNSTRASELPEEKECPEAELKRIRTPRKAQGRAATARTAFQRKRKKPLSLSREKGVTELTIRPRENLSSEKKPLQHPSNASSQTTGLRARKKKPRRGKEGPYRPR